MNRAINGVMFVMISAILLAWAPTTAYAGVFIDPVTMMTEDRKGNQTDRPCDNLTSTFNINIHGKGEYKLGANDPVPIPKGTGQIRVIFNFDNSIITEIKFTKNSGFPAGPNVLTDVRSILIDAKIANSVLCGLNIPKGTTSMTLTGVAD